MAEFGQDQCRGLQFAERLMLRHGWEQGKGLGREENGISEAIKVKVRCDKGGIGHKEGDQFTFHWWDHMFNKTSASLEVQLEGGSTTFQKKSTDNDNTISNKKPVKANLHKDKLYGAFVKSATLVSGIEQAACRASASDSSSSSDEDDTKLDLSSTTKLSDAQLMKACGGRTAHKGARHGLNMSAKLARLEQQEAEFMAKYGKKQPEKDSIKSSENEEILEEVKCKKKKKKKREDQVLENETVNGQMEEGKVKQKKKKKKKRKMKDAVEEGINVGSTDDAEEDYEIVPAKKKKKKSKELLAQNH